MLESSLRMARYALILASGSPRRRELLGLFDIPFKTQPADIDETQNPAETPQTYVWRLARQKGLAVAVGSDLPVLSADTIVEFEGSVWGKPADLSAARRTLNTLKARTHRVYTAISLLDPAHNLELERMVRSEVHMRDYSDAELQTYLDSGDWRDKAGGYAIQHAGFHPCQGYVGSYSNIMGLPLCETAELLRQAGFAIPVEFKERAEAELGVPLACEEGGNA